MGEHWFANRFDRDKNPCSKDNDIKNSAGEAKLKKYLLDSFPYSKDQYTNVVELCTGLAGHPFKDEERFTQIFVWLLNQKNNNFLAFRTDFLSKIIDISKIKFNEIFFKGELPIPPRGEDGKEKDKKIDIVAFANDKSEDAGNAILAIECKIGADFKQDQLKNYAHWLNNGTLVTITRDYFDDSNDNKYLSEQLKDYPNVKFKSILWEEIYNSLNLIKDDKIKEEMKKCFEHERLELQIQLRNLPRNPKLIKHCEDFLTEKKDSLKKDSKLDGNINKARGPIHINIYPKREFSNNVRFLPALGAFHIGVEGFLLQGAKANQKSTYHDALAVYLSIYYKDNGKRCDKFKTIGEKIATDCKLEWTDEEDSQSKYIIIRHPLDIETIIHANEGQFELLDEEINSFMGKIFPVWKDAIENIK